MSTSAIPSQVLTINEKIELRIDRPFGTSYYASRVEDIQDGYILVALPTESTELVTAQRGLAVGIAKKAEEGIFVLNGRVADKVLDPIPLLTIRTEGEWTRVQRRGDVRLPVSIRPLSVIRMVGNEERSVDVVILNLSAGGMLVRAKEEFPVSTVLKVQFELPNAPPALDAEIEVVRVDNSEVGQWKHYKMGARFTSLSERERDRIVKFIFKEQVRRRQLGRG